MPSSAVTMRWTRGLALAVFLGLSVTTAADANVSGSDPRFEPVEELRWAPSISLWGTPGIIDMPTAHAAPEGTFNLSISNFDREYKFNLVYQVTRRLSGSFRYAAFYSVFPRSGDHFDRSLDLEYSLLLESDYVPAFKIGLRDLAGTSVYSSEYFVLSKSFPPHWSFTAGLGFGRMSGESPIDNPLASFDDDFGERPRINGRRVRDQFNPEVWFRGDAAPFWGIEYRPTDNLTFKLEQSSDDHRLSFLEVRTYRPKGDLNLGLTYSTPLGPNIGLYSYGGFDTFAFSLGVSLNPTAQTKRGSFQPAPATVIPRSRPTSAEGYDTSWASDPEQIDQLRRTLQDEFLAARLRLLYVTFTPTTVEARINPRSFDARSQAVGRAMRTLANHTPASVETMKVVLQYNGVAPVSFTLARSDLEEIQFSPNAVEESLARTEITPAPARSDTALENPNVYPSFATRLRPYFFPSYFDPDNPLRADFGAELYLAYSPVAPLVFSTALRQKIWGNRYKSTRFTNSVLPHVRSDYLLYDRASDNEITHMTVEHFGRLSPTVFTRLTGGILERYHNGVSGEVLWKPFGSRFAYGGELNWSKKREFELRFGTKDYEIVTGHASLYVELPNNFYTQVDYGRYLANDWGATFTLRRDFANGWRVGAFFTLTDVPFEEFGEGSFDKGILLTMPFSWLAGEPTQRGYATALRPLTRDGGARLQIRNRLYDFVQPVTPPFIERSWGTFTR
ncbi:MAG: YjbH domain-containing protein [Pseudomonadota bacterium]